ncbi:MAG: Rieske (2Fe-2S) protein [Acidiferrobacterales bacterium]
MTSSSSIGQVICSSAKLTDGGRGKRFVVQVHGETLPAFAVRYRGGVYAFINRCTHRGVELDWSEGHFFDRDGDFLICATHGALYDPATGACVNGPCAGSGLTPLPVREEHENIYLVAEQACMVAQQRQ